MSEPLAVGPGSPAEGAINRYSVGLFSDLISRLYSWGSVLFEGGNIESKENLYWKTRGFALKTESRSTVWLCWASMILVALVQDSAGAFARMA